MSFTLCSSQSRIFSRNAFPLSDLESMVLACSSYSPVMRRGAASISLCLLRMQISGRLILQELSSRMMVSDTLLTFYRQKARFFLSAILLSIYSFFLSCYCCFYSSYYLNRRMDSSTFCLRVRTSLRLLSSCSFRWWFIFSTNLAACQYLGSSSSCSVLFLRMRERCSSWCLALSYRSTSFSYSINFSRLSCSSLPWEAWVWGCMLLELLRMGRILAALQRECSLALSLRLMAGRESSTINVFLWRSAESVRSVLRYFLLPGCYRKE